MLALSGRCLSCLHSLLFDNVQADAMLFLDSSACCWCIPCSVVVAGCKWHACNACLHQQKHAAHGQAMQCKESNNIYLHISSSWLSTFCLADAHALIHALWMRIVLQTRYVSALTLQATAIYRHPIDSHLKCQRAHIRSAQQLQIVTSA